MINYQVPPLAESNCLFMVNEVDIKADGSQLYVELLKIKKLANKRCRRLQLLHEKYDFRE